MKIMSYSYKLLLCLLLLLSTNALKAIEGFSLIPAGEFTMGNSVAEDTDISDAPIRTVTLDAYYIGKYEVTKSEWDEVRTWGLSNGYTDLAAGSGKASNHPVQTITWYDMVKWCNARSQKEGLTPAYYTNDAQTTIYKTGDVDVTNAQVNWSANGYRLPTEAEWEKAARGGLSGKRFPWGDTISHSQANYQASSNFSYDFSGSVNNYHPTYATEPSPYTSPVGAFAANGYGLHDMAGNVWEWCWDWYGTYAAGSQTNPRGSTSGTTRVGRGGGWHYGPLICRVAWRYGFDSIPTYSNMDFGFRVARSAVDADSDFDGLVDSAETNTGVFVSESNTGTNPNNADTDADGVPDGLEVKEKTSPVDATKFNSFSKGMVAYYPFNGNANDCSGNQRHGIVLGNVQLAADSNAIPNSCYEFDGNDYGTEGKLATIEVESPFLNTWEDFTISGMYCASDLSKERQVVVNSIPHVNISVAYNYMSSNTTFGIGSSEGWIGTNYEGNDGPPTEQQWRQFILRKSGTNYKLFINGALVRDENIPQSINFTETVGLRFGSISSNYNTDPFYSHVFSGKLDEFRVYQRALSDAEISGLYMKQAARFKIIEGSFTWHEAKADAEARGGRLAVLDTQEKIDDANAFLKSHDYWPDVWIGLTDEEQEGYWKWIDDSPLASSNWLQGEPNDMYGEDFALLYRNVPGVHSNGEWNDVGESFRTAYLLEHSQVEIFDTDGDGYADAEEIQWGSNPNDSASYPQVYLSIMGSGGGYIEGSGISMDDPWSGESYSGYVPLRSTVTLTAFAYYNHWFSHWYGDVGDAPYDTTLVLHMDSNKWVGANFQYNGGYWPPYDYDSDGDGIYDDNEYYYGTDPYNYDTDNDGLGDGAEVYTYYTNPLLVDSDGDGLTDGNEVYQHATNPLLVDTDGDGYSDGNEVQSGSNPSDSGSIPNSYSGPLFTDITTEVPSLAKHSIIAVMDYDRDGKEDLLVQSDSGSRLLRQAGSFQFDDVTSASGLDGLQNALVADFTNDGLEDVLDIASDKSSASIRLNNGEGYYVKTDLNQVLEGDLASYRDLMTGDIDNDGDIDLIYAVNPPFGGGAVAYLPNITERGAQNVQFGQKSYLVRTSWQFAKFDLTDANNDGLTDLVILQTNGSWPYDTHPDHPAVLYLGTGRSQNDYLNPDGSSSYVGFVEKADCGINAANEMSRFTSWDIDNDGDLDLINGSSDWRSVSNPHIYINDGAGNYAQQDSPVYHSGQYYHHGITIFDADADNDLDAVWTGLHNFSNIYPRMWKNEGGLAFSDATAEWGVTSQIPGSGNLGSSGYAADLDGDGDQDFVVQGGNGWGSESYYAVYRNNADQKGSKCLKIELEGTSSHAKGFGARVEVRANGKTLTQWVSNHVGSIPTTRLHFGLGESHDVEYINVYWPSGLKSSLSNPEIVGNTLKITEPASESTPQFQIIEGSFTWHEAKADAEARGGRLAVVSTEGKQLEVASLLPSSSHNEYFIGATDEVVEGVWTWLDGSFMSYSNWGGGEPNGDDYLSITTGGWGGITFAQWNDTFLNPSDYNQGYILEFLNQILTISMPTHGSITGSGVYNIGATATLTATADAGYIFTGWTGDATGTTNPLSLTMDADKTVGATFEPDLSDNDSDGLSNYDEIITHGTNPLVADTDGDGYSDGIEIQNGTNPLDPASVPTFDLTLTTPQYGSLSGAGTYPLNTNATLAATANPGYIFTKWTGDASGTENPLSLNMNADKTVGATFEQDLGDADGDGLSNYREAVVYGTNPAKADTDDDGLSDAWELGVGRFSLIVTASPLTWKQARDDARSKGGDLACFPNQEIWNTVRAGLGETALDDLQGVWIGASDAEVEGTWKWVNGLPFTFANWGSGRPNSTAGNSLDFLEISGGDGAELWKWYDRGTTSTRTRYLLEVGYSTNPLIADADADGLTDGKEQEVSTNPFLSDSDSDGLTDGEEISLVGTNPNQADSDGDSLNDANDDQDGDGLSNISEIRTHLTNPVAADSDADGLNDGAEINDHSTNPNVADSDGDGLTDGEEIKLVGTNPTQVDSDGDSLNDANDDQDGDGLGNLAEIRTHFTNPINPDSDSDNLTDREEIELTFTNPNHADSDGDNINDADDDQDGDGLNNLVELRTHLTNPAAADSDGDALTDTEEITLVGTNPNQADSDGDSLNDANDDQDGDGLSNISEIRTHLTNPVAADGDGDGLNDGAEINEYSTNPFLSDTDGDGLTDGHEVNTTQSNPKLADSNGDGLRDGLVVALGKNPMENISAFMSALMANRTELGLHKTEDITDMRAGSMMIERAAGADKLQFRMKLQRSNDLHNWQDDGEAVFEAPMGPSPSKQFYRFGVK